MSASLVRKGLELLSEDFENEGEVGQKSTTSKKRRKGPKSMKKDYLMKRISTNKQGVKKQLRQMKRKESITNKPTVMGKNIKSAIDAYYSHQSEDRTEYNVKNLLEADKSSMRLDSHVYEKIMTHSRGRKAKDNPIIEETETDTAFTDEDFEQFEDDYTGK